MPFFNKYIFIALAGLLILTGCVSREDADAQLVRGCEAGVNALLPDDRRIDHIARIETGASPSGAGHRHVTLHAVETDDWLETENTYQCIFEESFGFLNTSYTASIYQLRFDNHVYGRAGREVTGSMQDFIRLTDAIRRAMYE